MLFSPDRIRETLAPWVDRLTRRGIAVTAVVEHGRPAVALQALSARLRIDLLAMTTRRRTGFERWIGRSVVDDLLRRTSLPMIVLPTLESFRSVERE